MMTSTPSIFDIPVYRCTLDNHAAEIAVLLDQHLDRMLIPSEDRDKWRKKLQLRYDDAYWYRWQYNHTVGWLQLYVRGGNILANEFWISAKRVIREPRYKTFIWNTYKAICVSVEQDMGDIDIFNAIHAALIGLSRDSKYRARYIDLTNFQNIGPFVRWQDVVRSTQGRGDSVDAGRGTTPCR